MCKGNIISFFILALFIISACTEESDVDMEKFKNDNAYGGEEFEPSDESVFNLESKWENQKGDTVVLSIVAGKPTILAMIYTHCEYSCPLITADMKELHSLIPDDEKDDVIRFKVKPTFSEEIKEHLEYKVDKVDDAEGKINLSWEKVSIDFNFNPVNCVAETPT